MRWIIIYLCRMPPQDVVWVFGYVLVAWMLVDEEVAHEEVENLPASSQHVPRMLYFAYHQNGVFAHTRHWIRQSFSNREIFARITLK